ncbi:MAG: LysR substrate-binding domain-containing protein [Nevskiales bacterium]
MRARRLPPLHSLQAFEVAAQHLSFKRAAEVLHLTPSAVSHQIKALEDFLGFALFKRLNRALELTEGGRAYLQVTTQSLARLREGSAQIAQRFGRVELRISMGPFIASEMIVPALPSFQKQHPDVYLRIETGLRSVDLIHEDVDMALRFGQGQWPGVIAEKLLDMTAAPVCSPALKKKGLPKTPEDLSGVVLIHSLPMPNSWPQWAQAAKLKLGTPKQDLWLDSYFAILRAAEEGAGVAVGLLPMIAPWLRSGRLVKAWPIEVKVPESYYLLYRPGDAGRREIQAFRAWLPKVLRAEA